ncbi:MAG: hypothetical protein WD278_18110 [Pirellulales bacterium]
MDPATSLTKDQVALEMLGYLNFSSGTSDARFLSNLNAVAGRLLAADPPQGNWWNQLGHWLLAQLEACRGTSAAFSHLEQAQAVIPLVLDGLLPAYRDFHRELLFHQSQADLFQPFFVGRAFEAALEQGPAWHDRERIVAGALGRLNDFVGHRPVAVLRTAHKIEPYPHELVRPIPIYIRGAGVAVGRYQGVIEQALAILAASPPEIQEQSWFDLDLLDELAVDPRAYDFDHPVNKRPNYQFGQWDPHYIDNLGRYRRFVLQQVTLDALVDRVDSPGELARGEALFEAGAVLAGVMLMAAGISGRGPDTHDSAVTLATLLPTIAGYRDAFYSALLQGLAGPHGQRLRAEAAALKQPFGGARQHLNQRLARLRAIQLQHVHLAQLFARMGYPQASSRQARVVPVASARLLCEINGRLTAAHHAIDRVQLEEAGRLLPEIEDLLQRAIECGALVDPWNILGFQGQFSLFPAVENSVRDHRVDVLVHLLSEIFGLYARLQGEVAARGQAALAETLSGRLAAFARWWDRFATLDVQGVEHVSGREAAESAAHVAAALGAWHQAGAAAGDLGFWRKHVQSFNSPKAYALVVEALLEKRDFVASMALLIQWIGRAEQVPLLDGEYSFCDLAIAWLQALREPSPARARTDPSARQAAAPDPPTADQRWQWCTRFFDYLVANAEEYWEVPRFELANNASGQSRPSDDDPDDGNRHGLFSAAYEEVSYRDSTDDGLEADMLQGGPPVGDVELNLEFERLAKRLLFLSTLARLWKIAAACSVAAGDRAGHDEVLRAWFARAVANRRDLFDLLKTVHRYPLNEPAAGRESLLEYNRRRAAKEWLLARIIAACVDTSDAARLLAAAAESLDAGSDLAAWEQSAVDVLRAMFRGDAQRTQACFAALRPLLEQEPIVYVPLARHGAPGQIVGAYTLQQLLLGLLAGFPRLGLLAETCQVIETAHNMEQHRPPGKPAITEFGRLFEAGYRSLVEALVRAAGRQPAAGDSEDLAAVSDAELIECLERLTESLLRHWLAHSRSLRLSVLEKVADSDRWQELKEFVARYGGDLFTVKFCNLDNLRAILHQGVDRWLGRLEERDDEAGRPALLDDLDRGIPRQTAVERLTLAIEALAQNHPEFRDYKTSTTQSDRGELLYILLDFLRLKASYDRFAWNVRPLLIAHEILVRHGRMSAADRWRQATADRTAKVADWHEKRLAELSRQYGVRLPAVADRIGERFARPLAIDRLRALIAPANDEARQACPGLSFELLEQYLAEFVANPSGSGLDVPAWLSALEDEADHLSNARRRLGRPADADPAVPLLPVTWHEVVARIKPIEA